MSTVRLRRLQADYEKLRAFLARQPRIRLIQAQGTPPEHYQLEYQIRGLREVDDQLQAVTSHTVEIALPLSYPRLPPQCRMLTPVFHPNIAPHAICIGDHWNAGEPLWSMVARIGEMIAYQSYNTKSPLNGEAARWVEKNQDKLPLDRTNFMLDDAQPQPIAADPSVFSFADDHPPAAQPAMTCDAGVPPALAAAPAGGYPAAPQNPPYPTAAPVRAAGGSPPMAIPLPPSPAAPAMPNIIIQCGQCGARYSVPPTSAGKKVRCKKCQAILLIPARPSQP